MRYIRFLCALSGVSFGLFGMFRLFSSFLEAWKYSDYPSASLVPKDALHSIGGNLISGFVDVVVGIGLGAGWFLL